jgi:hypothetical protein
MQTTILIPTDFTIESLGLLKMALREHPNEQLEIVFVHGISLTDSITELLFFSPSRTLESLENANFREACAVMQNKFNWQLKSIKTVLFTGKTQSAFNQLLEIHRIDSIVVPTNRKLKPVIPTSSDLLPFIHKSRLARINVEWVVQPVMPEKDKLAELFAL